MTGFDVCADMRARLFSGTRGRWRVGAEIELIALEQPLSRAALVESNGGRPAILPLLRSLAAERSWREARNAYGIPAFLLPGVGSLSFEPGGQLELSTRPFSSPSLLLAAIRGTIAILRSAGDRAGIEFMETGLDPFTPVADVPLAFPVDRYTRMAAHFRRVGGEGLRMMKQTASCQLSLDVAPEHVFDAWRALNAIVPAAIAAFANSPVSAGNVGDDMSVRARIWQGTDPLRTGIFDCDMPVEEYCAFALRAPSFLYATDPAAARDWSADDATGLAWPQHLSTLFPEVRPRGYMEFRACDAVGDDGRAALLLLLCMLTRNPSARGAVGEITGAPDRAAYRAAPQAPPELLRVAADALQLALTSAREEPPDFWSTADLLRAERFIHEYTLRGRTPAGDWSQPLLRTA